MSRIINLDNLSRLKRHLSVIAVVDFCEFALPRIGSTNPLLFSVLHQSLSQSTASLSGGRRYSISNYFSQSSRSGRHQSIIVKLNHRRKASKKALRTVGLLLGCFFLTWCPFVGFFLYESCADELDTSRNTTLDWLLLLGMSNSLMNPIIYGRTNKEFKRFLVGLYRPGGGKILKIASGGKSCQPIRGQSFSG